VVHKNGIKYDLDGQYSTSHLLSPFSLKLFDQKVKKQLGSHRRDLTKRSNASAKAGVKENR
jgi:hypothetical protein